VSYEAWRVSFQSSEQAARAAYYEVERLRDDLADALDCKAGGPTALSMVIAERDTLRAQLAASEARAERLDAMLQHRADEAAEMERMLRAEFDKASAQMRTLHILLARYRDETPAGHQPHMIAHQADAALGRAAIAEGEAG